MKFKPMLALHGLLVACAIITGFVEAGFFGAGVVLLLIVCTERDEVSS